MLEYCGGSCDCRWKAFLVAGYFMHLISERKMVYGILAFTTFFVTGLMFLTVWSFANFPPFAQTR